MKCSVNNSCISKALKEYEKLKRFSKKFVWPLLFYRGWFNPSKICHPLKKKTVYFL